MEIAFRVDGPPVAQPRQRHSATITKSGKVITRNYIKKGDPVVAYKEAIALECRCNYKGPPLQGPLRVEMDFVFRRPRYLTWKTKPMHRRYHTAVPDLDNLEKAVFDALNGLLWADDSQVAESSKRKVIARGGENEHVVVRVRLLKEGDIE